MSETRHNLSSADLNRMLLAMAAMVLVMLLMSAYAWFVLPDDLRIPVHWNIDGKADRYGGKVQGLLVMPGIAFVSAVVLRVIPMIEPRQRNLLRSFTAYRMLGFGLLTFFLVMHAAMVGSTLGLFEIRVGTLVGMMVSALMAVVGNYLGKVRSNFMFGIRTPWTLSSDIAWDRTHRFGGRLFVLSGLVGVALIAFLGQDGMRVTIGLIIVSALASVVYSYFAWRTAPDRHPR